MSLKVSGTIKPFRKCIWAHRCLLFIRASLRRTSVMCIGWEMENIARKCVTVKSQPCLLCTGEKHLLQPSPKTPGHGPTHCFCKQITRTMGGLLVKTDKLSVSTVPCVSTKPFRIGRTVLEHKRKRAYFLFLREPLCSNRAFAHRLPMAWNPLNAPEVNQHHWCSRWAAASILNLQNDAARGTAGAFYDASGSQEARTSFILFHYRHSFIPSHKATCLACPECGALRQTWVPGHAAGSEFVSWSSF